MALTDRLTFVVQARDQASQVFQQVGTAVNGLSTRMTSAAAAIGVSFAGIGGMVKDGLAQAFDQMDVKNRLQAQLGTTNEVAKEQGKIAGALYAHGIADTFQEAADAIKTAVQGGLAPPDATTRQLESIAAKALDIAKVFEQELPRVTNAAGQLLRTGLAKDADEAFDIIVRGFQLGNDKADDLLDTINEYSTQFRDLGLNGAEAMGIIAQGLQGGARDADIVADALKELNIRVQDKTAAEGLKKIGLNADEMAAAFARGGPQAKEALDKILDGIRQNVPVTDRYRVAQMLLGTQSEDLSKALLSIDPSEATKKLGEMDGAADKLGKTIHSGPRHQIEVFKRTIEQNLIDFLGDTAIPAITEFVTHIDGIIPVDKVKRGFRDAQVVVGDFMRGLLGTGRQEVRPPALKAPEAPPMLRRPKSEAEKFGETMREVAAQLAKDLKPVADAALGIGKGFMQIATHTPAPVFTTIVEVMIATAITKRVLGLAAAFRSLAAGMSATWLAAAGPLGLAAAGVLGLAWAFSSASGNGSGLTDTLRFLKDAIVGPYGVWGAIQAIADGFVWVFSPDGGLAKSMSEFNTWVMDKLGQLWDWIVWVFSVDGLGAEIADSGEWLIQTGGDLISGLWQGIKDKWAQFKIWFTVTLPNDVIGWVRSGFGIASPARVMMPLGADVIRGFLAGALEAASGIGGWLRRNVVNPALTVFSPSASWLPGPGRALIAGFKGGISGGISGIGRWLSSTVVDPVTRRFSGSGSWLPGPGRALIAGFKGGISGGISGIGRWLSSTVVDPVTRRFSGSGSWLPGPGRWLISGFKSGISGGMSGMSGWLKRVVVDPVVKAVKKWFGIKSPSTVFAGIGRHLVAGLIKGLATTSGTQIAKKVFGDLPSALGAVVGKGLVSLASLPGKALKALGGLGSRFLSLLGIGGGGGVGKGVQRWAPLVSQVLAMLGAPASALGAVLKRIQMESGGNPMAINLWDINARRGDPSRGLMQTIGSTFRAYAGPFRSRGIYDPLANIYAGVNYAMHRYGANWIRVMTRPGGYDLGGIARGIGYMPKYTLEPERVLSPRQTAAFERLVAALEQGAVGGAGELTGNLYLDSGQFLGAVRGTVKPMVRDALGEAAYRAKVGWR